MTFLLTVVSELGVSITTGFETEWLARRAERRALANGAVFTEIRVSLPVETPKPCRSFRLNGLRAAMHAA